MHDFHMTFGPLEPLPLGDTRMELPSSESDSSANDSISWWSRDKGRSPELRLPGPSLLPAPSLLLLLLLLLLPMVPFSLLLATNITLSADIARTLSALCSSLPSG